MIERLKRIRAELAREIDAASRCGNRSAMAALVASRDKLNEALIALGDKATAESAEQHFSLDELDEMARVPAGRSKTGDA